MHRVKERPLEQQQERSLELLPRKASVDAEVGSEAEHQVLERCTDRSALLLRSLLGQIHLEPAKGEIGRPYYVARISFNALSLLAPPPGPVRPGRQFEFFSMVEAAGIEPAIRRTKAKTNQILEIRTGGAEEVRSTRLASWHQLDYALMYAYHPYPRR